MMKKNFWVVFLLMASGLSALTGQRLAMAAKNMDYHVDVPFLYDDPPPLVLLVMGRDHKFYYEAYNDASDVNEDGWMDVGYRGEDEPFVDVNHNNYYDAGDTFTDYNGDGKRTSGFDYFGYFDSYKCYEYVKKGVGEYSRFEPTSETTDKKCAGDKEWSGDFLNYLTTSRMDALRKVLYGGFRRVDKINETVLERVYVPQDVHSWGKEYHSIDHDGYDISDYTPLDLPVDTERRHLFASTTRTSADSAPLLLVLQDSKYRIWHWVAKQAPVCDDSVEDDGDPLEGIFTQTIDDHAEWDTIVSTYATSEYLQGSQYVTTVKTATAADQNPFMDSPDDYYIFLAKGELEVMANAGASWATDPNNLFRFSISANDSIELVIRPKEGQQIKIPDPSSTFTESSQLPDNTIFTYDVDEYVLGVYGTYPDWSKGSAKSYVKLPDGKYEVEIRYHEINGNESWDIYADRRIINYNKAVNQWMAYVSSAQWMNVKYYATPATDWNSKGLTLTDPSGWKQSFYTLGKSNQTKSKIDDPYEARVLVCDPRFLESNCKEYQKDKYKPTGLLHKYGEADNMYFGLLTGSYYRNTDGGILRKRIGTFSDEINSDGTFNSTGIVGAIDNLRIMGFNYNNYNYPNCERWNYTYGWDKKCTDWGNPVAEMMYEGLRYFAGKKTATAEYNDSNESGAPAGSIRATWNDPYDLNDGGFESCSQPYMLVISDINPSWDSDLLPNSKYAPDYQETATFTSDMTNMNVQSLSSIITTNEPDVKDHDFFIGESEASTTSDSACSSKKIGDLGEIRGICPEVPGQRGSYYAAAVAYYGLKEDISSTAAGNQNVTTMTVALAAPLPEINVSVNGNNINIVPFAKTVSDDHPPVNTLEGAFPNGANCTILDYFIEELTTTHGKFRINFEAAELGDDNDQDAIAVYEYQVDEVNNTLTVTVATEDAAACAMMHIGYVISGTTADGPYLEIKIPPYAPCGSNMSSDVNHPLDTPFFDTCQEGDVAGCCTGPNTPDGCWDDYLSNGSEAPMPEADLPTPDTDLSTVGRSRTFTPSSTEAVTILKNPLYYAAKWGGFQDSNTPTEDSNHNGELDDGEDLNSNNSLDYLSNPTPDLESEWDTDANGVPDNYFYVINPAKLEAELDKAFSVIQSRTTSGTATAVISNSSDGEGAAYQATFYPRYEDITGKSIYWAGQLNAFLIDSHGNFREDTDGDGQLDIYLETDENNDGILQPEEDRNGDGDLDDSRDRIIVYNANGTIYKYDDKNENSEVDETSEYDGAISDPQTIKYLWTATDWLNDDMLDPITQRSYNSTEQKRYIFTFIDQNENSIAETGELIDFTSADPASITPTDATTVYPYLTHYPSFSDKTLASWVGTINDEGNKTSFLQQQSQRIINFTRGQEQGILTIGNAIVPAMRDRTYYDAKHSETRVWRLGDTISSSPTMVARPAEMYHLLYQDNTYTEFYVRYRKRRSVIYMGGNDGMLHAFNAGFYDSDNNQFLQSINEPYYDSDGNGYDTGDRLMDWDGNGTQNKTTAYALGQELWAYVPYNLLPHLYWLTEQDYEHVSYMDLQPRILDAKVFFKDTSETTAWDEDHPNGWGTILVAGMKMGGGKIIADMNKDDKDDTATGVDRTMSSAYVIMDITNPEKAPTVLAEFNVPNLGYTTCFPAVVTMKNDGVDKNGTPVSDPNDWYLVFGSGPADSNGYAATGTVLQEGISEQPANLFFINLKQLIINKTLTIEKTIILDDKSYVSAPMAADFNLDTFSPDAVYFGTVSGSETLGWGGKMSRVVIEDDININNWYNSTLIDLTESALVTTPGRPITVTPNAGLGDYVKHYDPVTLELTDYGFPSDPTARNRWIYFGTGRYYTTDDAQNDDQQGFYGIKETFDDNGWTWGSVTPADLLETTGVKIYNDKTVEFPSVSDKTTWGDLIDTIERSKGWFFDFPNIREKNTNDSLLFGELLYFTNYEPSISECSLAGSGWLYAVYYKTGTAYYTNTLDYTWKDTDNDGIMDADEVTLNNRISTGSGIPSAPSLITTDTGETKVVIQTDDGSSIGFDTNNPGITRSGKGSWLQRK